MQFFDSTTFNTNPQPRLVGYSASDSVAATNGVRYDIASRLQAPPHVRPIIPSTFRPRVQLVNPTELRSGYSGATREAEDEDEIFIPNILS